ncbi:nucleotidyltransferase [Microtetraspora sp. NBRC 13810]|uniref:nucleotidyltransferase domain-containing protein n=1 Tax=Microtetraspora sp. NBRC 13810 TaxID=3030990 RepID=UPI0024A0AC76|nr:nucleotidyltransferase domain-containing protein [Microtetraspora sp. NBRC 13810]GLW11028.1 nucleotidyltransferase [Microtetraspora sp. NBRC 13810]
MDVTGLVPDQVVLSVVVGSRAYGLETEESDVDRRGVFVAPTPWFWRLDKPPTHVEGPLPEQFSWEVERFCGLALEANPTVLECLWSPLVERVTPAGEDLLALRTAFLSTRAHRSFLHYAEGRFRRFDPERPPWKRVMHMLRLLISGLHLARHGEPLVRMDGYRDRLLAVRRGETPWAEACRWRAELTRGIEDAVPGSPLPLRPDRDRVEEFLAGVRRAAL